MSSNQDIVNIALFWLRNGNVPLPLIYNTKLPMFNWHKWQSNTPSENLVKRWFEKDCNIGIICGGTKNLCVLDFDDIDYFTQWKKEVENTDSIWKEVLKTYKVKTSRGIHLYVYSDVQQSTYHNKKWRVDVRSKDTYVLIPPSIHPSGFRYIPFGNPENIVHVPCVTDMFEYSKPEIDYENLNIFEKMSVTGMHSSGNVVENIKSRYPILEFVLDRGKKIYAKDSSHRYYMTRCMNPAHKDHNPSMRIDTRLGTVKCLSTSCDWSIKSKNIIGLYAAIHGIDNKQAIEELAQKLGIEE
jgi:hypothetical protein